MDYETDEEDRAVCVVLKKFLSCIVLLVESEDDGVLHSSPASGACMHGEGNVDYVLMNIWHDSSVSTMNSNRYLGRQHVHFYVVQSVKRHH